MLSILKSIIRKKLLNKNVLSSTFFQIFFLKSLGMVWQDVFKFVWYTEPSKTENWIEVNNEGQLLHMLISAHQKFPDRKMTGKWRLNIVKCLHSRRDSFDLGRMKQSSHSNYGTLQLPKEKGKIVARLSHNI